MMVHKPIQDRTCVITGATSGIGYQTALALAGQGMAVVIIGRNPAKSLEAANTIKAKTGNNRVSYVLADLSAQREIHEAAKKITVLHTEIDVLINNAGTWLSKYTETEDGIETTLAVNHLSYFLLSHLLLKNLAASGNGRIINVGSDSHFQGKIHFDDLNLKNKYHGLRAYAQSKLANVLYTYSLDRILKDNNIPVTANCVQPGLVKTDIGVKHTISLHALVWKIRRMGGVTPEEGAKTSVHLAVSPDVEGVGGKYWDRCAPKRSSKASYKTADADALWEESMKLCGIDDYLAGVSV